MDRLHVVMFRIALLGVLTGLMPGQARGQEQYHFEGATLPDRVAVVNGKTISAGEVQEAAAQDLKSIDLRRAQFEVEQKREREAAFENALETVIRDRLLEAEAKKRNLSVDELLAIEVESAAPMPADDVVVQFYNANKTRLEGSLGDNVVGIRDYLRSQQRQAAFDALIGRLRKGYEVKSYLQPSRTTLVTTGRPSKGPADAPITIVEFSDFQCPYCRELSPTLRQIATDYSDQVRIVYMQFPLADIHPEAEKAAEASLCAHEQDKFWQLHDAMFEEQTKLTVHDLKQKASGLSLDTAVFAKCLESGKHFATIKEDVTQGVKAGVSGTPAMFINGRALVGNLPYAEIQKLIEDELQRFTGN